LRCGLTAEELASPYPSNGLSEGSQAWLIPELTPDHEINTFGVPSISVEMFKCWLRWRGLISSQTHEDIKLQITQRKETGQEQVERHIILDYHKVLENWHILIFSKWKEPVRGRMQSKTLDDFLP
jgi:hypothetical protein